MRATIFCNHYRAMSDHATCAAGVAYETLKGIPFEKRPCFCKPGKQPNEGCPLIDMPTPEQIAAEEEEWRKRFELIGKARAAIVDHCGGPWKKGLYGKRGVIDCPACGAKESLHFTRAGVNGHIHAQCKTEGCVSWME